MNPLIHLQRTAAKIDEAYHERDQLIVRMRQDGVPVARMAEALGMTRKGVYKILERSGGGVTDADG